MSLFIKRSILDHSSYTAFRQISNQISRNTLRLNSNRPKMLNQRGLVTISNSIKDSLIKHEIIPTVIHDKTFTPKGLLIISYGNDKDVVMGNTLKVEETQSCPDISFTLSSGDSKEDLIITNEDNFTLVLTDPDAPTKGDEKWSEYCHYVRKNIKLNSNLNEENNKIEDQLTTKSIVAKSGHDILSYVGPGPPPKTGKHRYVFLLYKQPKDVVDLSIPEDRPCWGTNIPGSGVAEWSKKNNLELLAVNFFYAQNKDN